MYYGLSKYVYNEKNCNSPFYKDPCFSCKLTSCEGCILKEEEYDFYKRNSRIYGG